MIDTRLMDLFTRYQRIETEYPETTRIQTPFVVRHFDARRGGVVYANLTAENADPVIRDEIAFFTQQGVIDDFEWKYYDTDMPLDLPDRLRAHGFTPGEPEAVLVLDLAHLPPRLAAPPRSLIRRALTDADIDQIVVMHSLVWHDDQRWLGDYLKPVIAHSPDRLSAYIADVDGVTASAGWIDFNPPSPFSGLWGGSTLPEYRHRGLYTDLVAARAQEAIARGVQYLTIDASPMSRAVLEKLGFELLCMTIPFTFSPHTSVNMQADGS